MKKAITIKEIAEQLNLSRNTVSKGLNGKYVPERTRALILEKAKQLNYKSMSLDENILNLNKKYRILLLSGKPLNNINFFIPIIRGIENYCYQKKYELFQYTFDGDYSSFEGLSNYVKDLTLAGIIAIETFNSELIQKLIHLNKPICFVDFSSNTMKIEGAFDIVQTNNHEPFYQITKDLIKKYGIKRFSFVGDFEHCLSFQQRYFGMLQSLTLNKISHSDEEDILRRDNFDYGNPSALKTEILKLKHRPDCFICSNDFIARSVCHALKQLGWQVPKDILVVGYDNSSDALLNHPTITSVGMDKESIGFEALRTLEFRIENPKYPTKIVTINSRIIYRETTKR